MKKLKHQSSEASTLSNKNTQWYQVPVIWLCIGIFIITITACAHLIVLSLERAPLQASESASTKLYLLSPSYSSSSPSSPSNSNEPQK